VKVLYLVDTDWIIHYLNGHKETPTLEGTGHGTSYSYSSSAHRRHRTSQSRRFSCRAQTSPMTSKKDYLGKEPLRTQGLSRLNEPWSSPVEIPVPLTTASANPASHPMSEILHIAEVRARSSHLEIHIAIRRQPWNPST
jgi:hypothetical protein